MRHAELDSTSTLHIVQRTYWAVAITVLKVAVQKAPPKREFLETLKIGFEVCKSTCAFPKNLRETHKKKFFSKSPLAAFPYRLSYLSPKFQKCEPARRVQNKLRKPRQKDPPKREFLETLKTGFEVCKSTCALPKNLRETHNKNFFSKSLLVAFPFIVTFAKMNKYFKNRKVLCLL